MFPFASYLHYTQSSVMNSGASGVRKKHQQQVKQRIASMRVKSREIMAYINVHVFSFSMQFTNTYTNQ